MARLWLLSLVFTSFSLVASDHIDGPVTSKHKITDLTDFYAFASPEKPGFLTMIANAHPLAVKKSHYSDKVLYRFTLREAAINAGAISTVEKSERVILCTFVTPHRHDGHTMTCKAEGMERTVGLNKVDNKFDESGLRLFHGHRADPFFFNAGWAKSVASKGKLPAPAKDNTMSLINALSIVMDVDVAKLFGHPVSLLALTVESLTKEDDGKLKRFDRIGRPEVTNVTMVAHDGDTDLRDVYNLEKAFAVSEEGATSYRKHIQKNIAFYDKIDASADWTAEKSQKYSEIIVDDFLLVDLSKEAEGKDAQYFGIEMALLEGKEHTSCGGRRPDDDIMDRLFTILINSGSGKTISDGVNAPASATSKVFPYLAAPDFSWKAWKKAKLADIFI